MRLFGILCCISAGLLVAQPAADPAATARKALESLLGGRYAELNPVFTPDMQKAFPDAQLAKLGFQLQSFGAMGKIADPVKQPAGPNTIVVIPVEFAKGTINFRCLVNSHGQIAQMFLIPGATAWQRPGYSKPDAFHEAAVTVGDDEWKLPGTLALPNGNGPFAAVVLVQGSGPSDRDESIGAAKPFRDLAEGLASHGIAVLRYEKRTAQYRGKMAGMTGMTIDDETVEDAVRAAELLRTRHEIDPRRIYVLGHSLGGYAAPRIAADDGKLAGLIFLAANARHLEDLIVDQVEYLQLPELANVKAEAKRIKALETADTDGPPLLGMPVSYLLDLKDYDPVAAAKKLTIPMLFLQGGRDYQVTMKDFALWKTGLTGRGNAAFQDFPSLNHLFETGEGRSTESEYRKPGHVAPEVIDAIAKWVK